MMQLPDLKSLQEFSNPALVQYYANKNKLTTEQSATLLRDLLGWMWLTLHRKNQNKTTFLFGPLLPLDEFWHCFILHTRLYQQFCLRYFSDFFHHDVEPFNKEHQLEPEELADFLQDCMTFLGESFIDRYFSFCLKDDALSAITSNSEEA